MGGSKLKNHNVTPRRQSLRLKGISAIYEAGVNIVNLSLKHQGQNSGDYSAVANQIKLEMLETEESQIKVQMLETEEASHTSFKSNERVNNPADSRYPGSHSYEETNTCGGDRSLNILTLKDLRASCKAKKRKVMKSGASAAVDLKSCSCFDPSQNWKVDYVKLKEEELDLEEPLITLKLKVSKGSTADRKHRKRSRLFPVSLVPMEVVTAKTCSPSSNDVQSSMPVAKTEASIPNRPSKDSASDQHDIKSEAEPVEEHFGGSVKKNFVQANNSLQSSTYAGGPESVYCDKTEIVEPCSLNGRNTVNIDTNSTLDIINTCNFLDNFSSELLQKVGEELNNSFPSSAPDFESVLHGDSPELAGTVKNEILENESPLHENTICIAASSTVDAKFNYFEESSAEIFGRVEDVLENQGSNSPSNTSASCCLNEVSTEYMEPDEYFLLQSGEKHAAEIWKMDLPEMSNQKLCPSSVSVHKAVPSDPCSSAPGSVTLYPGSDICVSTENHCILLGEVTCMSILKQMQCSASCNSYRSMDLKLAEACASVLEHEDAKILTHDLPVQEMPICSHIEDVTDDPSLLSKEHDLGGVFSTGTEGECLNNSAHHAVTTDEPKNSNEGTRTNVEEFTTEAYKLHSPQSSHTCCGANSQALAKISHKDLSSKVEGHTKEATSESVEISGLINAEELIGEPDLGSPKISLPCSGGLSGLHYADNLSKAAGKCSSSGVDEKLHAPKDEPPSEISQLIDGKGQNMEEDGKHDQGILVDNPPKKLLSNRKTISPTSQEKLCQALNDIDLCDASQLPSHKEAETFLAPEQMRTKLKNHTIGSLLSVNKGILRSSDASCKTPCSCMKSSSSYQQAEKAIEFSQRQMRDIENIATKLLRGLKSMKSIVEEILSLESCSSLPSKFTADEMRAAADNASELERTTMRWLSMMTKDCNRFCKIMRLGENKQATPPKDVSKKQKKITFADEAGGVLCQVKVFKHQPAPVVVPETDKADVIRVSL